MINEIKNYLVILNRSSITFAKLDHNNKVSIDGFFKINLFEINKSPEIYNELEEYLKNKIELSKIIVIIGIDFINHTNIPWNIEVISNPSKYIYKMLNFYGLYENNYKELIISYRNNFAKEMVSLLIFEKKVIDVFFEFLTKFSIKPICLITEIDLWVNYIIDTENQSSFLLSSSSIDIIFNLNKDVEIDKSIFLDSKVNNQKELNAYWNIFQIQYQSWKDVAIPKFYDSINIVLKDSVRIEKIVNSNYNLIQKNTSFKKYTTFFLMLFSIFLFSILFFSYEKYSISSNNIVSTKKEYSELKLKNESIGMNEVKRERSKVFSLFNSIETENFNIYFEKIEINTINSLNVTITGYSSNYGELNNFIKNLKKSANVLDVELKNSSENKETMPKTLEFVLIISFIQ